MLPLITDTSKLINRDGSEIICLENIKPRYNYNNNNNIHEKQWLHLKKYSFFSPQTGVWFILCILEIHSCGRHICIYNPKKTCGFNAFYIVFMPFSPYAFPLSAFPPPQRLHFISFFSPRNHSNPFPINHHSICKIYTPGLFSVEACLVCFCNETRVAAHT